MIRASAFRSLLPDRRAEAGAVAIPVFQCSAVGVSLPALPTRRVDWTGKRVSEIDIVPEIGAHVIGAHGKFERSSRAWITPGFVAVGSG
jgi:hypothetical protein